MGKESEYSPERQYLYWCKRCLKQSKNAVTKGNFISPEKSLKSVSFWEQKVKEAEKMFNLNTFDIPTLKQICESLLDRKIIPPVNIN